MIEIKTATTVDDIISCWETMYLLRPILIKERFVENITKQQKEGYVLLSISEKDKVVAVLGYRLLTMLNCGKFLYVEDLSTLEESRGKGYASLLLQHADEIAKNENCKSVQLDSGPSRTIAHKLYYKQDFIINAFHFNKSV